MATVLIVEDNPTNMELAVIVLEKAGHKALSACNAEIGLAMARVLQPDVILMDIHLPGIDGLEATVQLKQDDSTCHIPVIALTALAMKGDEERIRLAGCDSYLSKPLHYKILWSAIETWSAKNYRAKISNNVSNNILNNESVVSIRKTL